MLDSKEGADSGGSFHPKQRVIFLESIRESIVFIQELQIKQSS